MKHTVEIPDMVWEWAQKKSGQTVPGNFIRDLLYRAMIDDVQESPTAVEEEPNGKSYEARWRVHGCQLDQFDLPFTEARAAFIDAHDGDEEAAVTFIEDAAENKNMKYPRGWIMKWYKDSQ